MFYCLIFRIVNIPIELLVEHKSRKMELKTNNQYIVYLNWKNKNHVEAVSNLHMKLLPESILSKLGYLFLSKFYYKKLVKYNLIDVYLYMQKEEYVGFISCTNKPFTFMGEGMKKNLISIIGILGLSLILNPYRLVILLGFLFKVKKDMLMENLKKEYGNRMGEFLSFGVLENYRKIIDPLENISIPNVLMKLVSTHFKSNNIEVSLLRILASNERAIRFYQKHSGYIIPSYNPNQVVILIQT